MSIDKGRMYCLKLSCPDQPGIVALVTAEIAAAGGNIREASQFEAVDSGRFFMRVMLTLDSPERYPALCERIGRLAGTLGMVWGLRAPGQRLRSLILVSGFDHCLVDLLYRHRIGELEMDIVGIASNHPVERLGGLDLHGHAFHHLPVTPATKVQQEAGLRALITETQADLIILARYMQILSDDLAEWLAGRCINIHHSFLPGFKGAKPYHQAFGRGVKMIGATAHYVSAQLDEGPIIVQDVEQITHADRPEDLIRKGRDIERRVLARAVRCHLEDRVFLNGDKTVVFMD